MKRYGTLLDPIFTMTIGKQKNKNYNFQALVCWGGVIVRQISTIINNKE